MKKIKDFCIENKILLITGILLLVLSSFLYFYYNKSNNVEYNKGEEENIEYVKSDYKVNQYQPVTIDLVDLLNDYYSYYINLQINKPEEAFELLTDDSKEKFNNDIEEYKKYVKKLNTVKTLTNKIEQYRINEINKQIIEIIDSEDNKFTIYESAVWNFKISIDGKK